MGYQPIKDNVVVRADKDKNAVHKIGNIELFIETKFDQWGHATKEGEVVGVPLKLSKGGEVDLVVGDKIYCHHFLTSEQNEIEVDGEKLYTIDYRDVFCRVRDGEITMIGEWCFCDPITEKEEGYIYEKDDVSGLLHKKTASGLIVDVDVKSDTKWAVLRHLSKEADEYGLKSGVKVMYRKDCDYEIEVEGKKFYRIRTKDLMLEEA